MILLDTHAWIWMVMDPKRLSKPAVQAIRRAAKAQDLAIASISLYEAAWLFANRRVRIPGTVSQGVRELIDASRVQVLEVVPDIASVAAQLPEPVPSDPADRLIVATALVHAVPLVTRDARILESGACNAIW